MERFGQLSRRRAGIVAGLIATLLVGCGGGGLIPSTSPSELVFSVPQEGAILADPRDLSVTGDGILSVVFSLDGAVQLEDDTQPFEWTLTPGSFDPGAHVLMVTARTAEGDQSVSVDVTLALPPEPEPQPEPTPEPEPEPTVEYGLEWPGSGSQRRMLYWDNPFPIYDATYVFRVYPRKKPVPPNPNGYYTTFFWGNNGEFGWNSGNTESYYGAHPYPTPAPNGAGQWEISVWSNDYTTGSEVDWGRWYVQAFRAWRESPTITHHEFYWDLPDTSKVIKKTIESSSWGHKNPPSPAIVMGQAPDNGYGVSWGGYEGWEEFNGIIRGIQIYSGLLSVDEIKAEIDSPKSTSAGQTHIWYLNLNPRPGDVADKKGVGAANNPKWDGTTALEWSSK